MMNIKGPAECPMYIHLRKLVESQIAAGELVPGDRICTETDFAGTFHVSRTTIRRALAGLERDGIIVRFPGKGTFINRSYGKKKHQPHFTVGINFFAGHERSAYYGPIVRGILASAAENNVSLRMIPKKDLLISDELDGCLFTRNLQEKNNKLYARIAKGALPAVGLNVQINNRVGCVGIDSYSESCKGMESLLRHGCRKIAFYGNRPAEAESEKRFNGYQDTLKNAGLPVRKENIHFFDLDQDFWQQAISFLQTVDIDSMFISPAAVLPPILYAVNILKLSVLTDLRLLIFDDLEEMHLNWPGISYIKIPLEKMGTAMMDALYQQLLLKEKARIVHQVFPCELIEVPPICLEGKLRINNAK